MRNNIKIDTYIVWQRTAWIKITC